MDVAQTLFDVSPALVVLALLMMLGLESRWPLGALLPFKHRARHALTNVLLALCTSLVVMGGTALLLTTAHWAQQRQLGLLNQGDTPWLVRFGVALVGIDFFEWFRHRLHHRVPLLWRLHRVHHTDPHVDTTTSIRGHPLESVLAYAYFSLVVLGLGIDPLALAGRTLVAVVALAWHHASFSLPEGLDALISLVTPTPRTHRLHHSREVRLTDSNYGTLFTWWDRLAGTFTAGSTPPTGSTGLDGFDSPQAQSLWGILKSPFKT